MPYEITETVPTTAEYTEVLTLIHNVLVEVNDKLELLNYSVYFVGGVLVGALAGCIAAYFLGGMMRGN